MDALKDLVDKIPDWLRRLDDLSGQIDRRQAELAAVHNERPPAARSLRNKGSAESLKPKDDGPMHADFDAAPLPDRPVHAHQGREPGSLRAEQPLPVAIEGANRLALHQKARDAVVAAHSRAVAQSKRRRRSCSVVSAEGAPPTYRTRSMIIVYYDSYVQGFFDELVRFTSSGRNLLRKARMSAKVAQIKRMAELEMHDDDNCSADDRTASDSLPSLRYMSTRQLGVMSAMRRPEAGAAGEQSGDVIEYLDKSLEFVQSACEHGAHQFLREADCGDEIKKIQTRITEVLNAAQKEIERIKRQDQESANESADAGKNGARRAMGIGRERAAALGNDAGLDHEVHAIMEVSRVDHDKSTAIEPLSTLEVDDSENQDEGIDVMIPKLHYRSTRYMRSRAG